MMSCRDHALAPRRRARTAAIAASLLAGALALGGCGHSDPADAPASADNVEMPAEEALSGVAATPAPDPMAASDAATDASGDLPPAKAAAQAASDAAQPDAPTPTPSAKP